MNKKKIFLAVLALILVCSISVAGTLAYMQAQQSGEKAVVNTFVAAGGGNIINPEAPDGPKVPNPDDPNGDKIQLQKGFYLLESKSVYDDTTASYNLDNTVNVIANTYAKAVPCITIPKNPNLTVDIEDGVDAYVFVKVIDTTNTLVNYVMDPAWSEITAGSKVYVYTTSNGSIINGADAEDPTKNVPDLNGVSILKDDQVIISNTLGAGTTDIGKLKFEAYVCQAGGFTSPADAYNKCFNQSNSGT